MIDIQLAMYRLYITRQMAFSARERAAKARAQVETAQGSAARAKAASQELLRAPIYPFNHFRSELTIERA